MRRQEMAKEGRRREKKSPEPNNGQKKKPHGHERMIVWQNIDKLDILVQKILRRIPRNEFKMRSQIDNASDSIGANFVEGYYSGSLAEYLRFLHYSKRSLGELRERVRRVKRKGYIVNGMYEEFTDCAIKTMYLMDRLIHSLREKRQSERSKK